jgi:hypothetical protein
LGRGAADRAGLRARSPAAWRAPGGLAPGGLAPGGLAGLALAGLALGGLAGAAFGCFEPAAGRGLACSPPGGDRPAGGTPD